MDPQKHARILDCAARFFARFGFRKTSVAEIANEAGVAKGTVYLAASSKSDLFYQVIHQQIRDGVAHAARRIDPRKPADALLPEVLAADLEYFDDRPLVKQLLLGRAGKEVPEEADQFEALRRIARTNLVEVIQLGQRQGIFRTDLDADQVAELVQDIQVATLLFHDKPGIGSLEHPRWRTSLTLFLDGLRPPAHLRRAHEATA